MLKIRDLTYSFDNKVNILSNINLDIEEGEIVALIGKSGAGKSTLLNIIAGFINKDKGKGNVIINDVEVSNLKKQDKEKFLRENIGFIFQKYNLLNNMDVLENVQLPLEFLGMEFNKRYDIAFEKLVDLGIEDTQEMFPKDLSGGQQQRVAICRAIVNNPKLILADEPTGNLDSENAKNVMEVLRKINRQFKTTILIITHDLEIAQMSDRIIKMADGRIIS
ncbi:MAG: ABC transporter ATP-binding protein [Sarcina sp.]